MNHETEKKEQVGKPFLESHSIKNVLKVLGIAAVVLLTFKAGEFVGYHKAGFSFRMGDRYYRGFEGGQGHPLSGFRDNDLLMSHGTFGTVLSITTSSFIVADNDNSEKTILVNQSTTFRRFRDTITFGDITAGDRVVVLGDPTNTGQIEAKLVRTMP